MLRSPLTWLAALWIGAMIHLDWHLGRPAQGHLSFGLPYHWLLAVLTFAPLPWLILRRRPASFVMTSTVVITLGLVIGQGLEPLGEVISVAAGVEPFTNVVRWRVFAEFMVAGLLTYVVSAAIARNRSNHAAA